MGAALLVHNRTSPCISECICIKAKLSVSSAWWLLNRGANNGKLSLEWPKGGRGRLIELVA